MCSSRVSRRGAKRGLVMRGAGRRPNFTTELWNEGGRFHCLMSTIRRRSRRRWESINGSCCEDLLEGFDDRAVIGVGVAEINSSLENGFVNFRKRRACAMSPCEVANQAHVLHMLRESSLW